MTVRVFLSACGVSSAFAAASLCNPSLAAQGGAIARAPLSTPADVEISAGSELVVRGLAAGQVLDKRTAFLLKRPREDASGNYWVTMVVDRKFLFMARPSESVWVLDPVVLLEGHAKREATLKIMLTRHGEKVGEWSQKITRAKPVQQP